MEKSLRITPYLYFDGNCEEALKFYSKLFSATAEPQIDRYANAPMQVPEDYKNKVLHGMFQYPGGELMGCDIFPGQKVQREGINIELTILPGTEKEANDIFNTLAESGKILEPLKVQFWGDLYGKVEDRFGIRWIINYEMQKVES